MTEQRHELFTEGCEAFCNGRYRVGWTKTMIGFGREDTHFVLELTANFGIKGYQLGNDFRHIAIRMDDALADRTKDLRTKATNSEDNTSIVKDPDQFSYLLVPQSEIDTSVHANSDVDPVLYVSLSTTDLDKVQRFYVDWLGMKVFRRDEKSILIGYAPNQTKLEFVQLESGVELVHGEAFGRLAIATPSVSKIHEIAQQNKISIVTGPIVLHTPEKADVEVIIVQDLDGYEICYAGEEGFYALALGQQE